MRFGIHNLAESVQIPCRDVVRGFGSLLHGLPKNLDEYLTHMSSKPTFLPRQETEEIAQKAQHSILNSDFSLLSSI